MAVSSSFRVSSGAWNESVRAQKRDRLKQAEAVSGFLWLLEKYKPTVCVLSVFVRNRKSFSSFSSSSFQHFATIHAGHSFAKSVLVLSFSYRWLKSSLCHLSVNFGSAKIDYFLKFTKRNSKKIFFSFVYGDVRYCEY